MRLGSAVGLKGAERSCAFPFARTEQRTKWSQVLRNGILGQWPTTLPSAGSPSFESLHSNARRSNETHSNAPDLNRHTVNSSCFVNLPVLIYRVAFDRPVRAIARRPKTSEDASANTGATLGIPSARLSQGPTALRSRAHSKIVPFIFNRLRTAPSASPQNSPFVLILLRTPPPATPLF